MLKTVVSKELCIGCEMCVDIAPKLYQMENDGKAAAIKGELSPEEYSGAAEAADACPTEAITSA